METIKKASAKKARPVTITVRGELAARIRKLAKTMSVNPEFAALSAARLGSLLCDPCDAGVALRDSMRFQNPVIEDAFDLSGEVTGTFYKLHEKGATRVRQNKPTSERQARSLAKLPAAQQPVARHEMALQ